MFCAWGLTGCKVCPWAVLTIWLDSCFGTQMQGNRVFQPNHGIPHIPLTAPFLFTHALQSSYCVGSGCKHQTSKSLSLKSYYSLGQVQRWRQSFALLGQMRLWLFRGFRRQVVGLKPAPGTRGSRGSVGVDFSLGLNFLGTKSPEQGIWVIYPHGGYSSFGQLRVYDPNFGVLFAPQELKASFQTLAEK